MAGPPHPPRSNYQRTNKKSCRFSNQFNRAAEPASVPVWAETGPEHLPMGLQNQLRTRTSKPLVGNSDRTVGYQFNTLDRSPQKTFLLCEQVMKAQAGRKPAGGRVSR